MSDQLGPPPVEPLSDVAWARLERGLWARMDNATSPLPIVRPARRWLWIAAPMVAAAAVILVIVLRSSGTPQPVVAQEDHGSDASDVRVVAPATGPTTASFNDAFIELEPSAAVVMRHGRPTTVLERGAATFAVAPRAERPPFVVLAGDATVRVIGTKFRVARSDERITVEVEHGIVEVQFRGEQVRVGAHQTWTSDHPHETPGPVQSATRTKLTPQITHEPDASEEIELPPTKVRRDPPKKAEPPDADRAKFERSAALETKDPKAAIAGYLELSQTSARWAPNALYAAGRLAADRGDPRARSLLTVYLRRFPTGANVDDARSLLARLPKGD